MIGLLQELDRAGALLYSALEKYLGACSAVHSYYQQTDARNGVPQALSDRVASELALATSYETKIRQAKSIISQARNCSIAVVPINSLPAETLIHIFHLVVDARRPYNVIDAKITPPKYPDVLAQVCTRWRQIIVDSPALWSHIDISPFNSLSQATKARAEAFVSRSGNSLLDVHAYEPELCENFDRGAMLAFFASIAPRIRSLELVAPKRSSARPLVLDSCFGNCLPKTFAKLSITNLDSLNPSFLNVSENVRSNLDALLLPVTALRLTNVYLPWTHLAYHGLVELCLTATHESAADISVLDLINILGSSPGLRVLHFGLVITHLRLGRDSPRAPVHLDDLEVLNLTSMEHAQIGPFLQLLAPGCKPLHICFAPYDTYDSQVHEDMIKSFFARSNVTRVHVKGVPHQLHPKFCELLGSLRNLQVLAVDDSYLDRSSSESSHPRPSFQLGTLYLTNSHFDQGELKQMIKHHSVKKAVFWECTFVDDGEVCSDVGVLQAGLSAICSAAICIDKGKPNPIDHWY